MRKIKSDLLNRTKCLPGKPEILVGFPAFFLAIGQLETLSEQLRNQISMKTIVSTFESLYGMTSVCMDWFYQSVIDPDEIDGPVPPIRYDGDPTDIYLA